MKKALVLVGAALVLITMAGCALGPNQLANSSDEEVVHINHIVAVARDVATILALLSGSLVATFVFLQFAPILSVRISPTWADSESHWVIVRLEVENKSRVRARKRRIRIQVLEHETPRSGTLSEWIPFKEDDIREMERPVTWGVPTEVFKSTGTIYPGEALTGERLHYCPPDGILHLGLQVEVRLGLLGRIVARVRGRKQRWTTTRIVIGRAAESPSYRPRHATS